LERRRPLGAVVGRRWGNISGARQRTEVDNKEGADKAATLDGFQRLGLFNIVLL